MSEEGEDTQEHLTNHLSKQFLNWPEIEAMKSLTKDDGYLNEATSLELLVKFQNFLRFYSRSMDSDVHKDEIALSQMILYVDKLLEIFSSTNRSVQLQAGKLLLKNEISLLKIVMDLSLKEMDTKDINSKLHCKQRLFVFCDYFLATPTLILRLLTPHDSCPIS